MAKSSSVATTHKDELERLKEKDPEFYKFLQDHDQELLKFEDEDNEDDIDMEVEDDFPEGDEFVEKNRKKPTGKRKEEPKQNVITAEMVDSWCNSVQEDGRLSAVRSLLRAFKSACHYGDDTDDGSSTKLTVMSSAVFNKIMFSVLTKMDGILRNLLKLPAYGGKKETVSELVATKHWRNCNHLVKSYLGNALHVLNQMTDADMISFTLRRLKYSSVFLAAFPSLLRRYIKVLLHFWGTGRGSLPVVSFLFMRDTCIRLGSDCLDECLKGIYKQYVLNCHFVNAVNLQHIQFLANCVIELLRVDLPTAYQHAFVFIRQLATLLRDALNTKTKEAFRKVYEWKFINCLELWTGAICAYRSEADFRLLAYPLTQILTGVSRLVPTARYFPLRLRCVSMLNRIAAATETFIPVSMLLLDMLEMKELNKPPTGGVGKAVDLRTILKVSKPMIKTRAFQEACVISVVEELAEHLSQWSYSVAFFELSFVPAVRVRAFSKSTKAERFRKEMRQLIRQIEENSKFTNQRRSSTNFLPNDPAAMSYLKDEKSGTSPLAEYVVTLRQRAQQRTGAFEESSVLVGENSSLFGSKADKIPGSDEEDSADDGGAAVFRSSSWLPGSDDKSKSLEDDAEKNKKTKKKKKNKNSKRESVMAQDEDIVEDLVMSSDEEGSLSEKDDKAKVVNASARPRSKKRKHTNYSKSKEGPNPKKYRKRQRAN